MSGSLVPCRGRSTAATGLVRVQPRLIAWPKIECRKFSWLPIVLGERPASDFAAM